MTFYFKLFGICAIVCASTLFGFYKSGEKKTYEKRLFNLVISLRELKEKIRQNTGELSSLIPVCFESDSVKLCENKIIINSDFTDEDKSKLNEFFSNLGMSDIESESKKCDIYISLFEERYKYFLDKNRQECKLFRTLGFLFGVFLSIFLL